MTTFFKKQIWSKNTEQERAAQMVSDKEKRRGMIDYEETKSQPISSYMIGTSI